MAENRPLFLGPRLRRLRRELGLTQAEMAEDLDISSSYVALLERNQRPTTANLLMRLAKTYRVDIADLAAEESEARKRLAAILKDPIFEGIEVSPLEVEDFAASFPAAAEAMLRLHAVYEKSQSALADETLEGREGNLPDPVARVRDFLAARRNYFPELEAKTGSLFNAAGGPDGFTARIQKRHGLKVRRLPADVLGGSVRRYDRHRSEVLFSDAVDAATLRFQTALQLVYLELSEDLDRLTSGKFELSSTEELARRALANYAAAALLMPYDGFRAETLKRRYDVEALARKFSVSFEQAAHRLTTLQKPGAEGVSFFFIRIDPAGNVSKRLDGAGFPFARYGGACPLWNVHAVFKTPRRVRTQWLELPDGARFFSIARTVTSGGGSWGAPRVEGAVALGCAAEQARELIYSEGDSGSAAPTPIGIACRLCQRSNCPARAVPPVGRDILPDDYHRASSALNLAEG
ncbi:XRE family transcriptional regulator [Pacificimonas flava]|uniref:XRE family transcriptional regulator n=2 Tax=Pacificimonas TaxID=1960290 RepID=A0A219B4M9_9SPHN|nr:MULTISPECIES: XRE family transcriptional regulator [Pacificimonas]MBZ6377175.1 DUF2083 domain-containing protein [Pacificimonas aurantium]OWV33103.1 XRE family transcriptional regulator [Pacificimonas flava]